MKWAKFETGDMKWAIYGMNIIWNEQEMQIARNGMSKKWDEQEMGWAISGISKKSVEFGIIQKLNEPKMEWSEFEMSQK